MKPPLPPTVAQLEAAHRIQVSMEHEFRPDGPLAGFSYAVFLVPQEGNEYRGGLVCNGERALIARSLAAWLVGNGYAIGIQVEPTQPVSPSEKPN